MNEMSSKLSIKENNKILWINTNVELLEIYDKTLGNVKNIDNVSNCNIDASLLLNALFLSLKQLLAKIQLQHGGRNKLKKTKKNRIKRTIKNQKKLISKEKMKDNRIKNKNMRMRKTKKELKLVGGSMMKLITSLMLSILTILNITKYVAGVQPENDDDVLDRLMQVEKIKEIFENKYGTCAINTALFLGSINLDTYEKVSKNIIERGHGLSYSEVSEYLNSSLKTLWGWDLFNMPLDKNKNTKPHYLRGIVETEETRIDYHNEKIREYINILKDKMREIRENKIENTNQGVLTAMSYPSYGVHHSVVIWLSSDDTLVIIDPQEFFVHSGIILYTDDLSKYGEFERKSIEQYFSENLEFSNIKKTAILMDYHVKREENLMELTDDNEKVKKVIENMNLIEDREM